MEPEYEISGEDVKQEGTNEPKLQKAVVIGLSTDGKLIIQEAKHYFEDDIVEEMDDKTLHELLYQLNKDFELSRIVKAVKNELAATMSGGNR